MPEAEETGPVAPADDLNEETAFRGEADAGREPGSGAAQGDWQAQDIAQDDSRGIRQSSAGRPRCRARKQGVTGRPRCQIRSPGGTSGKPAATPAKE